MKLKHLLTTVLLAVLTTSLSAQTILLETEAFDDFGGWVLDQQFMHVMGSPYLLAHGLGNPVKDATTSAAFPKPGKYHMFVRTRDWVAPWKAPGAPGKFQVLIDGKAVPTIFGTEGAEWHWQDGGMVDIANTKAAISLHDLTGFEGRCDAILFSADASFVPPNKGEELASLRRKLRNLPAKPDEAGSYDLVVVGGGMAGSCAAISAARLGLTVAFIQDRPVIGGNNSSEVRVWLNGIVNLEPMPRIGDIVRELEPAKRAHTGADNTADIYEDDRRLQLIKDEKTVTLFMNHRANGVECSGSRINAVLAENVITGRRVRCVAKYVADCTGHGDIGALAGATFVMADKGRMGSSNLWGVADAGAPVAFPRVPWAVDLSDKPFPGRDDKTDNALKRLGAWFWESGFDRDPLTEGELIRDTNFRAMYGAWDALKNVDKRFPNHKLLWAAHISGPRESRRLMGDLVLKKEDLLENKPYPDACFPTTWDMDLHVVDDRFNKADNSDPFISRANFGKFNKPYWVPYRCLYSKNVDNLFMAGRNISVAREPLGSVRVMRTAGAMGEVVGMAASVAKKNNTDPRGVYEKHLDQLKALLVKGVGKLPPITNQLGVHGGASIPAKLSPPAWLTKDLPNLARTAKVSVTSSRDAQKNPVSLINDGKVDLKAGNSRWLSGETLPQNIQFAWDQPQTISAVRIINGWITGTNATGPITDFVLQYHDGAAWRDIPSTKTTANIAIDKTLTFPAVQTSQLRLTVTAAPGDLVRIYEIEIYNPSK